MKLGSFCQLQSSLAFIAHFSLLTRPDWVRKLVLLMTVMSTYLAMMWRTARSRRDVTAALIGRLLAIPSETCAMRQRDALMMASEASPARPSLQTTARRFRVVRRDG
jgi:hypothetical protein